MTGTNLNYQVLAKNLFRIVFQSINNQPQKERIAQCVPGSIQQKPFSNRAGLFKLFTVCTSSLYFGGLIAHLGASYLEENDIFVPAEDDDED